MNAAFHRRLNHFRPFWVLPPQVRLGACWFLAAVLLGATNLAQYVYSAAFRAPSADSPSNGQKLFEAKCGNCHAAAPSGRVPSRSTLQSFTYERILAAMERGSMRTQASSLSADEKRSIAKYLSPGDSLLPSSTIASPLPACVQISALDPSLPQWNGWSADLNNSRFSDSERAGLRVADVPYLKLKWAIGFPGETVMRGQPTLFGGRVFLGTASGAVYSLDAKSGCAYWTFRADAGVRTAPMAAEIEPNRWAIYFGDGKANAYAVDARTGVLIWKTLADPQRDSFITGSPRIYQGVVYLPISTGEEGLATDPAYPCCKLRGSVVALDAQTGKTKWLTAAIPEAPHPTRRNSRGTQLWGPSGAPIWSAITIDQGAKRLYTATGNSYSDPAAPTSDAILALSLNDGRILWSKQVTANDAYNIGCDAGEDHTNCPEERGPDYDFGSSPLSW